MGIINTKSIRKNPYSESVSAASSKTVNYAGKINHIPNITIVDDSGVVYGASQFEIKIDHANKEFTVNFDENFNGTIYYV